MGEETMTDRELLELAAKAAGWESWDWLEDDALNVYAKDGRHDVFEPLTDDGDALRLAVNLGIQIDPRNPETRVFGPVGERVDEYHKPDAFAATRRAIVRAAAEIGKGLE
jgi:hypothetical protein